MPSFRINYGAGNNLQPVTYSQSEIIQLVEKAAGGNFESFGNLYHLYVERIYRYVFYQVKDKMTAEDITADVFMKALDNIESCRGKEATFSSWLYRIAHNCTVDNFRMANRNLPIDTVTVSNLDDPKQEVSKNLEREEISAAIALLPQNQRQLIMLKFIEGFDNREIGRVMGKSQVAVRLLQLRALKALRKYLGGK